MKSTAHAVILLFFPACALFNFAVAADDAKRRADEAIQRITFYQDEAIKLSSSQIFKELERQRSIQMLKNQNAKNIFAMDDDTYKATGYATALESRRKTNEPAAAFFYGVYNTRICNSMQSINQGQLSDAVKECWLTSLESFKVASNAQIAAASFNLAKMYEGGSGVMPSKLVAAEWYVKAANQYNKEGSREEALTSVEAALNSAPDHPAALRLKQAMLR